MTLMPLLKATVSASRRCLALAVPLVFLMSAWGGGQAEGRFPAAGLGGHGAGSPGLPIDPSTVAPAVPGFASRRVSATSEQPAGPFEVGAFRTACGYSHTASDDPIVYPGQPGRSHSHTFFGNTGTNADSNSDLIANSGNSTCRGGIINRSAYWVPTMVDTRTSAAVNPEESIFYYKTGYNGVRPADVRPFPPGLRIIAGDATNRSPEGQFRFQCHNNSQWVGQTFPNCPVGDELVVVIFFPQCWDGTHLDSPDHKSHMAYPQGSCPASHPVPLPEITFNIHYRVTEAGQVAHWRLSSDTYTGPAGYSAHGDWWNGWDPTVMQRWVQNCANLSMDCHAHLLGSGLQMF